MTATSRLGLDLITGASDVISSGDNSLSATYQKIDDSMGAKIATTVAAVPGSLTFKGAVAYETTLDRGRHHSGSAWLYTGSSVDPTGNEDDFYDDTQATISSETKIADCTFTAVVGRKYWYEYQTFTKTNPTGAVVSLKIRWAIGNSTSVSSTLLEEHRYDTPPTLGNCVLNGLEFFPNINGQVTVGLFITKVTSNVLLNVVGAPTIASVEDWGV